MNMEEIVAAVRTSPCFQNETQLYLKRAGIEVCSTPRLFKHLENNLVRVVFATTEQKIDDGSVIAVVNLYDLSARQNIYAHTICAGPGVNALLKAIYSPLGAAKPQPGIEGDQAIAKFVAWKQAAWVKFLNDELDVGTAQASTNWIDNFWKALDRMFGGGFLLE